MSMTILTASLPQNFWEPLLLMYFREKSKTRLCSWEMTPVLAAKGVPDQEVWAGIRPEGFLPDPEGPLSCTLERVEVMGRDVSIIASHKACVLQTLRAIVNGRESLKDISGAIRFRPKPGKIFLFRKGYRGPDIPGSLREIRSEILRKEKTAYEQQ